MVTFVLLKMDMRAAFERAVCNGKRPAIPDYVNAHIKDLIVRCWSHSPDDRPRFENIITKLNEIEQSMQV